MRRREGMIKGRSNLPDKGGSQMKRVHGPRYRTRLLGFLWSVIISGISKKGKSFSIFYYSSLNLMPVTRKELIKRKKNSVERGE